MSSGHRTAEKYWGIANFSEQDWNTVVNRLVSGKLRQ